MFFPCSNCLSFTQSSIRLQKRMLQQKRPSLKLCAPVKRMRSLQVIGVKIALSRRNPNLNTSMINNRLPVLQSIPLLLPWPDIAMAIAWSRNPNLITRINNCLPVPLLLPRPHIGMAIAWFIVSIWELRLSILHR